MLLVPSTSYSISTSVPQAPRGKGSQNSASTRPSATARDLDHPVWPALVSPASYTLVPRLASRPKQPAQPVRTVVSSGSLDLDVSAERHSLCLAGQAARGGRTPNRHQDEAKPPTSQPAFAPNSGDAPSHGSVDNKDGSRAGGSDTSSAQRHGYAANKHFVGRTHDAVFVDTSRSSSGRGTSTSASGSSNIADSDDSYDHLINSGINSPAVQQVLRQTYVTKLQQLQHVLQQAPGTFGEVIASCSNELQREQMWQVYKDIRDISRGMQAMPVVKEPSEEALAHAAEELGALQLPPDFDRYLESLFPDGEAEKCLAMLWRHGGGLLDSLRSVYSQLQHFQHMPEEHMTAKYLELSSRMAELNTAMAQALQHQSSWDEYDSNNSSGLLYEEEEQELGSIDDEALQPEGSHTPAGVLGRHAKVPTAGQRPADYLQRLGMVSDQAGKQASSSSGQRSSRTSSRTSSRASNNGGSDRNRSEAESPARQTVIVSHPLIAARQRAVAANSTGQKGTGTGSGSEEPFDVRGVQEGSGWAQADSAQARPAGSWRRKGVLFSQG